MPGEKICTLCGTDCSDRPRIKDAEGRYACKECAERLAAKKPRPERRAPSSGPPSADPVAQRLSRPHNDANGQALSMDDLLGDLNVSDDKTCPGCRAPLKPGAVVCIKCGFNCESGRKIVTHVEKFQPVQQRKQSPLSELPMGTILLGVGLIATIGLAFMASQSEELGMLALAICFVWNVVMYFVMVFSAFYDDRKVWGWLGLAFFIPLANLASLLFVLYYCTLGSERTTFKLHFWLAFLAWVACMVVVATTFPEALRPS